MTIFKSQKVTDLEAQVATLQGENATLTTDLATAQAGSADVTALNTRITELETANAEIPTLNATITGHETAIAAHAAVVTDLTEKAVVSATKIDAAAADKLAAMGHGAPLPLGAGSPTGSVENKTRAEINAMKPAAIKSFISAGGKITE